jgi:hypothetical protein
MAMLSGMLMICEISDQMVRRGRVLMRANYKPRARGK